MARVSGGRRRLGAVVLALTLIVVLPACGALFPRHYEYEEEVYLALDGSATVYVNASIPALVALRGLPLEINPRARVSRAAVRQLYESPVADVTRVSTSRRAGRRFVHVRIDVPDIRKLSAAAPFAWSTYSLARRGDEYVYKQQVGPAAGRDVGDVGWTGTEQVAFRMHLPSKIRYHDAPSKQVERGNILTWEQSLADRRAGRPLGMEVRLDTQSILYRTLWLFGSMIALVVALFAGIIWWVVRKGRQEASVVSAES
jgi:hypothetical protein